MEYTEMEIEEMRTNLQRFGFDQREIEILLTDGKLDTPNGIYEIFEGHLFLNIDTR